MYYVCKNAHLLLNVFKNFLELIFSFKYQENPQCPLCLDFEHKKNGKYDFNNIHSKPLLVNQEFL